MKSKVLPFVLLGSLTLSGCANPGAKKSQATPIKVERGDVSVQVVETGYLNAKKSVEVKSRVSGRVKKLFVEEGDRVVAGQLIAEIDPQETQLQVEQNSAQVSGAEAGVRRQSIEIAQRRVTAKNAYEKAQSNLRQIQMELKVQPTLTNASINGAQSAFDQAVQSYDQLEKVTHPNARVNAQLSLRDAENGLKNARTEMERMQKLLDQGYVARRDTENAQLQMQLAESKLRSAQETIDRLDTSQMLEKKQASERVTQAKNQLSQAKANSIQDSVKREQYLRALREVSDAKAQLNDINAMEASRAQQLASVSQLRSVLSDGQRQLGETRILAPVTGIVTKRPVQVGELVSSLNSFSAGTTIVKIEDRSQMVVQLNINEIDVAKLNLNNSAEIKVDAFPTEKFTGKVTKIAPANITAVNQGTDAVVKYEVEVAIEGAEPKLKSGMSAKCTMRVVDRKNVLRIPTEYVSFENGEAFVNIPPKNPKDPKSESQRVKVKTGVQSVNMVEIESGLKEGDEIVKPKFSGPKRKGMMDVSVSSD